jgi:hypothetical protein
MAARVLNEVHSTELGISLIIVERDGQVWSHVATAAGRDWLVSPAGNVLEDFILDPEANDISDEALEVLQAIWEVY